jgi:hypothetical protein
VCMTPVELQGLVESFSSCGVVLWESDGVVLRVRYSNRVSRDVLGAMLNESPQGELARILIAAMKTPREQLQVELKDLLRPTTGEKFGILARVFGLSDRLVCAHIYTSDFPLVVVEGAEMRDAMAVAVAAVDTFALSRVKREDVQQIEALMQGGIVVRRLFFLCVFLSNKKEISFSRVVFCSARQGGRVGELGSFSRREGASLGGSLGSVGRLSLEFLLQGTRGDNLMLDSLPCPSLQWDSTGRCLGANKGLRALLGAANNTPLEFADTSRCVDEAQRLMVSRVIEQLCNAPHDASVQRTVNVTLHRLDESVVGTTLTISKPSTSTADQPIVCVQAQL